VGKTTDLVFQYRQQATEPRGMAGRLEMEAVVDAHQQDQEQAKHTLDVAKDMRLADDMADEQLGNIADKCRTVKFTESPAVPDRSARHQR
jgi:hypothetical protein